MDRRHGCQSLDCQLDESRKEANMKSTILKSIAAITIFVTLAIPIRLAAQVVPEVNRRQIEYSVINVGALGGNQGAAYGGVNNRGWVAGDANLPGNQTEHGFLWRNGMMTDLGTLGGLGSGVPIPVKDDKGLIVGGAQTSTVDPLGEFWGAAGICENSTGTQCQGWQNLGLAFLWQNGVMTALPTLGGNNGQAFGVNNRGQVVGIAETAIYDASCIPPQVLDFEAVIWGPKVGQIQELPVFPGDSTAAAIAINDRGQVVGTSGICGVPDSLALGVHAVLWQNGSVTDLGSFGGVMNNAALDINNGGQVVGISDLPADTTTHAFLWRNGVMTDLGMLPGDALSTANDINAKGQVVGNSCDVNFNCRVFLWQNGVMTDLNALIPPDSPLYLTYGGGINDRGEIAGQSFNQNTGDTPAFLAIPVAGSSAVQLGGNSTPRVPLPEKVRKGLQRRMRLGLFGTPLMGPQ
jgi:probable HAF family extracellular repeat protein